MIQDSIKYHELTQGLFNPAMGKLIEAWGFHQSAKPVYPLIAAIKKDIPGMHDLVLKDNRAVTLNPYLQLDFGAIAKGLAVRQITELIRNNQLENFIINAGGDIYAQGNKHGENWRVAIENPFSINRSGNKTIASLQVTEPVSIFTSGNYRRYFIDSENKKRHHIINPITGEPSENISSITVLHQDPVIADIAATTLMLTLPSELKLMAAKLGIQDFLVITEQREIFISQSMLDKITWTEPRMFEINLI